jgi:succinyl-diaminopimelate desuccinylase
VTGLAETLAELIEIRSETGDEEEITTALEFRLSRGLPVERLGNALVVGQRTGKPFFVLYGHTDTVPDQGNGTPVIRGGRMHGLGSSDMKAGLAVMLHLLEDEELNAGSFDIIGVFYDKEEGPADENGLEDILNGFPWLIEADLSIVLEPTDLQVEVGCNGALNADVIFLGQAAHAARPWLGDNAITKAGEWLAEMHRRPPELVIVDGLEFREVFSVTRAEGGIANNVIPARFMTNVNYRFPPIYELADAEARLRHICVQADDVVVKDRAPAAKVPVGNPHLTRLESLSGRGRSAKQGWTDVARLSGRGAPAVNYGPGEVAEAHQAGESVPLANLDESFTVMRRFLVGDG